MPPEPSQPPAATGNPAASQVQPLLASSGAGSSTLPRPGAGQAKGGSVEAIQAHDFRHPSVLSVNELRKLRLQHEELVQVLAARLSIYLRLEFALTLTRVETHSYRRFVEGLVNPCHCTLFKVEPLRGVCLLDINPRLGLAIVDRLLGGPGLAPGENRDLSDIEVVLLDQAIQLMVTEWCNHWARWQKLQPVLLGHENNSRFLQTSPPDAVMLLLSLEARLGECVGSLQIAFPYSALEPLIRELGLRLNTMSSETPPAPTPSPIKWKRQYDSMTVPLTACWSMMELSARQLSKLKVGDVVQLPPEFASQVQLNLAGVPKFKGRLGTREGRWAIQVSHLSASS